MLADLDALVTALYVRVDDLVPARNGPGRPPKITAAELIALAVAQMFLGLSNDRKFSRSRAGGWGTCSPTCQSSLAITSACARWRLRSPGHHPPGGHIAVVLRRPAAALVARPGGVQAGRFGPPVYVTLWSALEGPGG